MPKAETEEVLDEDRHKKNGGGGEKSEKTKKENPSSNWPFLRLFFKVQ